MERHVKQQAGGKILDRQRQPVALHIVGLQRRCFAGRVGITVLDYGVRDVQTLPARPARPQAKVGIFAVQEKALVEESDIIQHLAAVQSSRRAWE